MEKINKTGKLIDFKILRRLFRFIIPYRLKFFYLVILTILLAVLGPATPYLVQHTVDNEILRKDQKGLINMIVLLIIILLVKAVFQYLHTYLAGWIGQSVIKDIRIKLYQHIINLKLSFFDKTPIGRLVTRVISDIETLADVFSQGIAAMIADVLQLVFILLVMFYTDWRLTLISLAMLPLLLISTYIFKEKIKKSFNQVRNAVSKLNTFVQEHISGMNIVQIFASEEKEYEKFKQINNEHKKANLRSVLYYSVYFPVAELMSALGLGLLIWYGATEVIKDHVTMGTLIAFIMYISLFFRPIRLIADRFNTLQMGVVSTARILDLLDNRSYIPNEGIYQPEVLSGNIAFKNVSFSYDGESQVIHDLSFEVKKGESVAIVGATGSGKTTIINLLSRFYELNGGSITIDGVDIRDYDRSYLRKHIGVVLQEVFLFSGSILDNIILDNPNITLEQVEHAARLVGAYPFIQNLPQKWDYKVMERGGTLSVGQRQLISFVRALVYDPTIMILDEATSSVDTETELLIQQAIEKLMIGRTSIVIAHRLSTIQKADKIIVLEKGEIKEVGNHEELLRSGSYYAQLHEMQYKNM